MDFDERIAASMENITALKGLYGYMIHGDFVNTQNGLRYCDVEFPNAHSALHFREGMRDMWDIHLGNFTLISNESIDKPCVMTITLDKLS